jgi:ATP synthase protein I
MPEPVDSTEGALKRLDEGLGALEASRRRKPAAPASVGGAAAGYRMLGQMLGGVLGGLGLGWAADHFVHTAPWGVIGGLVIGAGAGVFATVTTASRMSAQAGPPGPAARAGQDDEDEAGDS